MKPSTVLGTGNGLWGEFQTVRGGLKIWCLYETLNLLERYYQFPIG